MAGIPVVATTRGGGLLDVVAEGDHGRVVDGPGGIADAIEHFMGNADARRAAAAAGARWRQALAPATVAKAFERIYTSMIERNAGP